MHAAMTTPDHVFALDLPGGSIAPPRHCPGIGPHNAVDGSENYDDQEDLGQRTLRGDAKPGTPPGLGTRQILAELSHERS